MKKYCILLFVLSLVSWTFSVGQVTDKGNFSIGSTIGFSSASSKVTQENESSGTSEVTRPNSSQINIAPSVGYFILDDFAIGISMDYTFNNVVEEGEEKVKDSDLLFGPFARYYLPLGDDMAFILEANVGFGNATDVANINGDNQSIKANIFAFGVGPGFTIISGEAIGLEALIKYNYARGNFDTQIAGVHQKTTSITNQFDFSIGLQFYFSSISRANN